MEITCQQCRASFEYGHDHRTFCERISPTINGEKLLLLPPTLCTDCRRQRRFGFRNDQNYYRNSCAHCDKSLISIYSPKAGFPVLCRECFWNDNWSPLDYGREFDFSKPFFEQFRDLRLRTPRIAVFNTISENSDYTVHSSRNRNCYMSSSLQDDEDVYYSDFVFRSKDSMDLFACYDLELCYSCVFSSNCFNSDYLEHCYNLLDSLYCFDCRASQNLLGCVSIRRGKNLILNKPASLEECSETVNYLKIDSQFRAEFVQKFEALKAQTPKSDTWNTNAENCFGNYITNSKNSNVCFNVDNAEDNLYVTDSLNIKNCCDVGRVGGGEVLYECHGVVDLKYSAFCNLCYQCSNLIYCDNCQGGSGESFGCFSLRKNTYCILNKQYSEDEYKALVPRIVEHMKKTGEWGEFFPMTLSPFGYNEAKVCEQFPLSKEDVVKMGWRWSDYEHPMPKSIETVARDSLPFSIEDVTDDIVKKAIICEDCSRPFRVIASELEFYRKKGISIPSKCPKDRHKERLSLENLYRLYLRSCGQCGASISTGYSTQDSVTVYCDKCYMKEVY